MFNRRHVNEMSLDVRLLCGKPGRGNEHHSANFAALFHLE